ncbi:Stp1/IreP family PP2C-type Ser/Thr phosphatase [Weissella diestrammenae]|uniref:Stp1/IreP family PP2C-type Ser/Thr phosphatase n=1 Tax=Weissella diestrammenae TaxID=1162633 RepID=A0A7G9T507_9LACO|nr:Stp1/IreP family PP2C-type Ser/Thr phosphatase [Weissella diestrammenae]MCM0582904.1 Stp1/IreP family PP2C-type Ser/Thr phosphatase [Weissella diestrammenae]QNN75182.1 Stp1/IreP family PP2C-type Ser/Thr phosphatase [Weissella diestrammenae]
MKLAFATDRGTERTENQDYVDVFVNQEGLQLAIVADGVGGQNAGDVAATMAVSHIGNDWVNTDIVTIDDVKSWLFEQTAQENRTILQTANRYRTLRGMATTLVLAVILPNSLVIANLGDSRAYLLRRDSILQLTQDHNLASELLRRGAITTEEAKNHPGRHMITRQLGANREVKPDVRNMSIEEGDLLLLTTDGLGKSVSDHEIVQIIQESDNISVAVAKLIAVANNHGTPDNLTVLLGVQEGNGNK